MTSNRLYKKDLTNTTKIWRSLLNILLKGHRMDVHCIVSTRKLLFDIITEMGSKPSLFVMNTEKNLLKQKNIEIFVKRILA